jgi:anti-anti-sigma regulatory factor
MMAILIGEQDNVFSITGTINTENSKDLQAYIETQFKKFSNVIMNIDLVSNIDKNGVELLRSIHESSLQVGNVFTITGIGCKEIYDDFLMSN